MKSKIYTDEEIIEGILLNSKDVLSFLYEYNFDSLNKKVISEGGSQKDTEDVFHDALLVLFVKIRKEDFKLTSSVHTFLQGIARNLWKRIIASNSTRFVKLDENLSKVSEDNTDEEYLLIERRKLYLKHLAEMPNDCKRLIKLILDGLSLQEIKRLIPYNSLEFTKTKRFRCKMMLIKKIINDPFYNQLKNERSGATDPIPHGELTDVEKQQLDEKLKSDPSLLEKIATLKDVDNLLGDKKIVAFEHSLTEVETSFFAKRQKPKVARRLFLMQAAAVVVLVVSAAIYFLFYKKIFSTSNSDLFAVYYQKLPADFATRSENEDGDRFIAAIKLYNENRYREAITEFISIINQDPSNNAARLFLGICFTETNDFDKASDQFKSIVRQQDPIFEEHAMWYLALCYIKTQQPEPAKPLLKKLVDSRSYYMGKASELLRKLK